MADLFIDLGALHRTRASLDHIGTLMRDPLATMTSSAGTATEITVLRDKLRDFGDTWDYGIGQLSRYAGACSDALEQIGKVFTETDDKLASGLEGDR